MDVVRYAESLSPTNARMQMAMIRKWMNQAGSAGGGFLQGRILELRDFAKTIVGPDEYKVFQIRIGRQEYDTVIFKKAGGLSGLYRAIESKMLSFDSANVEKTIDALRDQFEKYAAAHKKGQGRLTQLTYSVVNEETALRIRMILGEQFNFTAIRVNNKIVDYTPPAWVDFQVNPLP